VVGIAAQELDVADLDRMPPRDLADHARHRDRHAAAADGRAGIVEIDPVERGGEAVGVALAPHLAVGDDVEAGAFLVQNGEPRSIVLRLFQPFGCDAPQLLGAHARRGLLAQGGAVD
jgi:hypothetical protein